jgi:CIC family chloride channel protein
MNRRDLWLCLGCVLLSVPAYFMGRFLLGLIRVCDNFFFLGIFSYGPSSPSTIISPWLILVPALGGLVVGLIARFGSSAVRGHGIPEVIETVIRGESRVPLKVALLKPLCAAISIGSGGPFGAEGPVIALGASLGSLFGQWISVTERERKVMLSAGAAAGITAVFGCPIAAMLLCLELLLFEFTTSSLVAVGLASTVSAGLRLFLLGNSPIFVMPSLASTTGLSLMFYIFLGFPLGLAAVGIIRMVHLSEELFKKLPIHWMWWPSIGGLVVGLVASFEPRVLGPGYASISDTLNGSLAGQALLIFFVLRLGVWVTALGSGTAGGTLAPLFGIGGGLGALLTWTTALMLPSLGLDPRMGALIGMAAVFAGASRALLASMVIALETTQQLSASLPLLGACLISAGTAHFLLPHSLMTESLVHRGIKIPSLGSSDF